MSEVNDAAYWEKRYQINSTGWDIGFVSEPLKVYVDQLEDKDLKILIPGCGTGYEAMYLLEQGFTQVHVLDFASSALNELKTKWQGPNLQLHQADIFDFEGSYDLILEQTLFCAIDPQRRKEYISKMSELLNANGKYVGLLFNREFEVSPPFGGSREEYEALFIKNFESFEMEDCNNSIAARQGSELFFIARK